jgi:hypothetical protein
MKGIGTRHNSIRPRSVPAIFGPAKGNVPPRIDLKTVFEESAEAA